MNLQTEHNIDRVVAFLPEFIKSVLPKIKIDFKYEKNIEINLSTSKVEPSDDPIKTYLNTIAYHSLLNKSEEMKVAKNFHDAKQIISEYVSNNFEIAELLYSELRNDFNFEASEDEDFTLNEVDTDESSYKSTRRVMNLRDILNSVVEKKVINKETKIKINKIMMQIEFPGDFLQSIVLFMKKIVLINLKLMNLEKLNSHILATSKDL